MKIILSGNSGAGKSSLLQQYTDHSFTETFSSTLGVDFKIKNLTLSSGKSAKLQLWDTAGQDRFRSIVASYWRGADGVLFVFDLTDPSSFYAVKAWALEVDRYSGHPVTKVLVGNKADLAGVRAVTREMAEELARTLNLRYFETSARTGEGVEEVFAEIAEGVARASQQIHGIVRMGGKGKNGPRESLLRKEGEKGFKLVLRRPLPAGKGGQEEREQRERIRGERRKREEERVLMKLVGDDQEVEDDEDRRISCCTFM